MGNGYMRGGLGTGGQSDRVAGELSPWHRLHSSCAAVGILGGLGLLGSLLGVCGSSSGSGLGAQARSASALCASSAAE